MRFQHLNAGLNTQQLGVTRGQVTNKLINEVSLLYQHDSRLRHAPSPNVQNSRQLTLDINKSLEQDTVVLWSKSSTLNRKVEGSNPAGANFSFEVDDLD